MSKSKNDIAWELLFEEYKIEEEVLAKGHIVVSSNQINKFREARLMTKFDHKSQLPKLFANNNLSILPSSRGNYTIGQFETFHNFNMEEAETSIIEFPSFLESLNYKDITSEATAINCAFITKILHDFTGEKDLYPTVSGRMGSSTFNFDVNSNNSKFKIAVDNAQIEIDGGYEGDYSLNLIEAKNYISDDFLVRQIYYPYRLWSSKIAKKVRSIFMTYSNGVFHLREYEFGNIHHYNSLQLVKQKKYGIQETAINLETIIALLDTIKYINEPNIPFPQANSFERVINLCELLNQRAGLTKEEITINYDFDARQTDYYINAGKYLGLIESKVQDGQTICVLSKSGKQVFNLSIANRQIQFIKLILSHRVFNKTLKLYLEHGTIPSIHEIVEVMKRYKVYKINSDETYFRRASTIIGWISWILNQIEE